MYCNTRRLLVAYVLDSLWWYSWRNHSECRLVYTRGIHENKNNEVRLSMPTYSYPEGWIQVVRSNLPPHLKRSLHSSHIPSSSQIIPNSLKHFSGASTSVVKEQGRIRRVWGYYSIMWPGLLRLAPAGSGSRYRCYCWNDFLCYAWSLPPSPGPPAQAGSRHSQKQSHPSPVQAVALLLYEKPRLLSTLVPATGHHWATLTQLHSVRHDKVLTLIQSRLTKYEHFFPAKFLQPFKINLYNKYLASFTTSEVRTDMTLPLLLTVVISKNVFFDT